MLSIVCAFWYVTLLISHSTRLLSYSSTIYGTSADTCAYRISIQTNKWVHMYELARVTGQLNCIARILLVAFSKLHNCHRKCDDFCLSSSSWRENVEFQSHTTLTSYSSSLPRLICLQKHQMFETEISRCTHSRTPIYYTLYIFVCMGVAVGWHALRCVAYLLPGFRF